MSRFEFWMGKWDSHRKSSISYETLMEYVARGIPTSPGTAEYGSDQLVGQEDQPQITTSLRVALPRPSKDCFGEAGIDIGSETWEERLQETIRFVFSHEQEGLLAIGTFALDQLAGVAHLDGRHIKPPATDHNSHPNSVASVQVMIREVRSSDDEIELHHSMRSPIPACSKRKESYPRFDDHDASSSDRLHGRALSVENTMSVALNHSTKHPPSCTDSPHSSTHEAGIKRVVPSTADQDQSDSEGFYSPSVCGLLRSRSQRVHRGVKEKRKKPPKKPKGTGECELKRADNTRSLGSQLKRLWPSCTGSGSAKVTPKKFSCSSPADQRESQAQGPPCIANVEELGGAGAGVPKPSQTSEVGERQRSLGHSFGKGRACAQTGKWIRTDSEFVVLEM